MIFRKVEVHNPVDNAFKSGYFPPRAFSRRGSRIVTGRLPSGKNASNSSKFYRFDQNDLDRTKATLVPSSSALKKGDLKKGEGSSTVNREGIERGKGISHREYTMR
ncbi:MAG: hypothetical protein RBT72_01740, partial [Spirochaetia bacterium]|nr:hypothetical protein [Spirochaetia bacterium]